MNAPDPDIRAQIDRCLLAYTRGIDRLDPELIATGFHPNAELEGYGTAGTTTIEAFIERAIPSLRDRFVNTQHRMNNTTAELRGDHVATKTYVLAHHLQAGASDDEPSRLLLFSGRYIDRFDEVDGAWRITHRRLRYDWSTIETVNASMPGEWVMGSRDTTDASYG